MAYPIDCEKLAGALQFPSQEVVDLVIDTDAYNEVDDQFAIAWALRSTERIHVEAVYAAPFCSSVINKMTRLLLPGHLADQFPPLTTEELRRRVVHFAATPAEGMEKSYREILNLFDLLGEDSTGRVFRGSTAYIEDDPDRKPVDSEAARDLIKRAKAVSDGKRLYVLAIGAITNVASALMMEPAIADKIVLVWLGGQPPYFKNGAEFNLTQDIPASQHIFNCGVPLVLIPCQGVASHLTVTPAELEDKLMGRSKVGDYLGQIVLDALAPSTMYGKSYTCGMDDIPMELCRQYPTLHTSRSRVIWDISTVGYVMNPNWSISCLVPSPVLQDNMDWTHDDSRHPIRLCSYVARDPMFGDLFAKLEQQA